jgi:CheY-like chemotaxis protein
MMGYAKLTLDRLPAGDPLRENLEEIHDAAKRSAAITRQLLAFARKETISPVALDLNDTVEGMLKMLRRLVGEDVEIAWHPGPRLPPVLMDPSQVDQLLANLCVNARDAIADVGRITISTEERRLDGATALENADASPGEYVVLAVTDTGCGMDAEIRRLIFEPFFTTKGPGRGTGLGLATVYGIVRQNGGFIDVSSEPGKGSSFRIHLPRHTGALAPAHAAEVASPLPAGRGETVLVVEDEEAIARLVTRVLAELGYRVLTAHSPSEALRAADAQPGEISLLLTDVVMPEMNGRDLAERLAVTHPGLRTLFMSGYTADAIAHRGVLEAGLRFLQKPFLPEDLAARVREALDAP